MPDIKSLPMLEFGSLNLKDDVNTMPVTDFVELLYWYNQKRNSLKKCLGYAKLHTAGSSSNPIHGLQRLFIGATGYLMVADSTTVKYWSGATPSGAPTGLETSLTSNAETFWAAHRGYIFRQNGTDAPKKWDGTNLTTVGIAAPGSSPGYAADTGGSLTGIYSYKITFYTSTGESNGCTASADHSVSANTINLNSIPTSADGKIVGRKIYRTLANGSDWFYLATIADNATTTYADNNGDSVLDTTIACPIHNEAMPIGIDICLHKSRMWVITPDTVYWSVANQPWHYDTAEFIEQPGKDDGSDILRCLPLGDEVMIYKENSIYAMQELASRDEGGGIEYQDFYARKIFGDIGLVSKRGLVLNGKEHVFVSTKGIHMFNGSSLMDIADQIIPLFDYVNNTTIAVRPTYNSECALGFSNDILYFSYPEGSSATTANKTIAYNFKTQTWFKPPTPATRIFARFFEHGDEERIYCGDSASTGFVYRLNYGEDAAGSDFKAILETKKIGSKELQAANAKFNFHFLGLQAECSSDTGILDIFYKREWDSSWKRLGKFIPNNYKDNRKTLKFRNTLSPSLQIRIECDGQESDITLQGMVLGYSVEGQI